MNNREEFVTQQRIYSEIRTAIKHLTQVNKDKYDFDTFDDLVQICAERVFNGISDFKGDSQQFTWIYRICRNTLINREIYFNRQVRCLNKSCFPMSGEDMEPAFSNETNEIENLVRLEEALENAFNNSTCDPEMLTRVISSNSSGYYTYDMSLFRTANKARRQFKEYVLKEIE